MCLEASGFATELKVCFWSDLLKLGRKADGANLIFGNWQSRESAAGATGLTGREHCCPSSELLGSG